MFFDLRLGYPPEKGAVPKVSSTKKRIFIQNLGCKVNLADAAMLVESFPDEQVRVVDREEQADVVVLNTCAVTHKAERDVRRVVGGLRRLYPDLPVIVMGCAVVTIGETLRALPNVRALVSPGQVLAALQAIDQIQVDRSVLGQAVSVGLSPGEAPSVIHPESAHRKLGRQRACLKVQDGCNAHCAYCIIPRTRGAEHSLEISQVVEKVSKIIQLGHREVVLTGIHLGRYGAGLQPRSSLARLLLSLAPLFASLGPGFRIRLSSIEPLEWTGELIAAIESSAFVCRHFHVPIQSGCDEVLSRMRRPYRISQAEEVLGEIRARFPGAALGTDILVGFPGETDAHADETQASVERLPFDYLHVFTFSSRPGTPAHGFPDPVDEARIRERSVRVRSVGKVRWRRFLEYGVGRRHQLLLEKTSPLRAMGHTAEYRVCLVEGRGLVRGEVISVVASGRKDNALIAAKASA